MSANKDPEKERRAASECLLLEISGQTWYVPFDSLKWVPRVGENVHITEGNRGKVAEVEYEFTPEAPPVRVGGEEMPSGLSYARPVRIVVKAT